MKTWPRPLRVLRGWGILLLLSLLAAPLAQAAPAKKAAPPADSTIEVKPGDTPRTLAERHLGDAELWREFLRANDLTSVVDVRSGMTIKLPPTEVIDAQEILNESRKNIEEANGLRARRCAPAEIARAITLREQALDERRRRNWKQALSLASRANQAALSAIEICRGKQDVQVEAQLADRLGTVESRPPDGKAWKDAELYGMLGEGVELRTQANAGAEILFRDESRLRMDANSQLVIQRLRADLLENKQQSKVSLVSGALFAVLGANRQRHDFDLQIPGVELKGNSKEFFVQRDDDNTRLANYQGQLEVVAKGGRVTLDQNEGVAVADAGLTGKRALLKRVESLQPRDGTALSTRTAELRWDAVEGAVSYWLEVGGDAGFKRLILSRRDLKESNHTLSDLPEGVYYWRVAAVDEEGFPGPRGETADFRVVHDLEPPFLALYAPEEGERVQATPFEIRGIVEQGSQLTVNGNPLEPDEAGGFNLALELVEGANQVLLKAVDAAGNVSEVKRAFAYEPEPPLFLEPVADLARDGEGRYLTLGDGLTFQANTLPAGRARLRDREGRPLLQAMANAEGVLSMLLPLPREAKEAELTLELTSPGGANHQETLKLLRRDAPPELKLTAEPPLRTATPELLLTGSCKGATRVRVNGTEAELKDEKFEYGLTLKSGGNPLEIIASDAIGNSSVIRREVLLDRGGPEVLSVDLKTLARGKRTALAISVKVQDQSPLHDAAPFELVSGDFRHRGLLRLNGDGDRYEGSALLPPGDHKKPRLTSVVVRDLLGNRTESSGPTNPRK